MKQLALIDTLTKNIAAIKCSLEHIINNSAFTIFYHFTHLQTEFHIRGNCFSLSGSTTGSCCPVGWTVFESTCYFFSSDSQSWTGSRDWCESQQAHLVILRNDKEWVRPAHTRHIIYYETLFVILCNIVLYHKME